MTNDITPYLLAAKARREKREQQEAMLGPDYDAIDYLMDMAEQIRERGEEFLADEPGSDEVERRLFDAREARSINRGW